MQKLAAVICNVRSAHNVGSMFRTADAAGIQHLYLCGLTPTPIPSASGRATGQAPFSAAAKIAKTALGAERSVSWEHRAQASRLLKELKKKGWYLVALEQTKKSKDIFSLRLPSPAAMVVGNEISGLPLSLLKLCDVTAEIPMRGTKESLNVSVAFGVAVYALWRHEQESSTKKR